MSHDAKNGDRPIRLGRAEFDRWYEDYERDMAEPARQTVDRLLRSLLADHLEPHEAARIRVSTSRVKSAQRLWDKLQRIEVTESVTAGQIPEVIDDIVGLRIVCNNTSDIPRVQALLAEIGPESDDDPKPWCIVPDSEKQYHERPKESGYRAYHLNVLVQVPGHDSWRQVSAEVQVRTLLQDAWGELTHEDTYKPGANLPPLASRLARRMADLLATVDDIAEDVRRELDSALQESLGEGDGAEVEMGPDAAAVDEGSSAVESVVEAEFSVNEAKEALVEYADSLERRVSLASAAHHLQTIFGAEVSHEWFGYGSFKHLVLDALPEKRVIGRIPGYLLPPGYEVEPHQAVASGASIAKDVPEVVKRLKARDNSAPTRSRAQMRKLTKTLGQILAAPSWVALTSGTTEKPGLKEVNEISRELRDQAAQSGVKCSRSECDYLVKGLFFAGHLRPDLSVDAVRAVLAAGFVQRTRELGLSSDLVGDQRAIREWMSVTPA